MEYASLAEHRSRRGLPTCTRRFDVCKTISLDAIGLRASALRHAVGTREVMYAHVRRSLPRRHPLRSFPKKQGCGFEYFYSRRIDARLQCARRNLDRVTDILENTTLAEQYDDITLLLLMAVAHTEAILESTDEICCEFREWIAANRAYL